MYASYIPLAPSFKGCASPRHPRHAAPQNSPRAVCSSNSFLFMHFRTLAPQWSRANHLESIASALFSIQRRGECRLGSRSSLATVSEFQRVTNRPRFSPHLRFLCFHALTNVPVCKLFVFKSLQQWGWVWVGDAN